jgi:hypothetical protein
MTPEMIRPTAVVLHLPSLRTRLEGGVLLSLGRDDVFIRVGRWF